MLRVLALACLCSTSATWAQGIALKYTTQDSTTYRFNASQCTAKQTITWTSSITFGLCSDLKLWSSELECGDNPGLTDVRYDNVTQQELAARTGDFTVTFAELPAFKYGDGGVVCGTDAVEKPHKICGSFSVSSGTTAACTVQQASSLSLIYDTKPPVAPVIDAIAEQDSALLVSFTATADTATVHVDARALGEASFTRRGEVAVLTGSSIKIAGLTNGTTYEVQVRAEDSALNISGPSETFTATPRLTRGFWATYKSAGGAETGGCSAVGGFPLLLAGALRLLRKKPRS